MKIGLFGGSFNPIHNGHIAMVNGALEKKFVDEVWIIPCKEHAFSKDLVDSEDRVSMINLAFNNPKIKVNTVELDLEGISYTYRTVKKLKENNDYDFYWICGADVCPDFPKWNEYKEFAKEIDFIIYNRDNISVPKNSTMNIVAFLDYKVGDNSSTLVRDRLNNELSVSELVPERVEKYINRKNLYK